MDWAERTHVVPWLGLLEAESEVSTSIQTATTGHNEAMNLSPYLEGRLLSDGASPSAYVPRVLWSGAGGKAVQIYGTYGNLSPRFLGS